MCSGAEFNAPLTETVTLRRLNKPREFAQAFLPTSMLKYGALTLALLGVDVQVANATTASVVYVYDQAGRLTNVQYDNNTCVTYAYDASGNRTAQNNGAPNPTWGSGFYGCFAWTSASGAASRKHLGRTAGAKPFDAIRTTQAAEPKRSNSAEVQR